MIALLETCWHFNNPLVAEGVLVRMPSCRLAAWPDNTCPHPWGLPVSQITKGVQAILDIWKHLPAEHRYLQIIGGLSRCCSRAFCRACLELEPTQADILRGLYTGCFACDRDIVLMSEFARMIRGSGMQPAGIWIDVEDWPNADPTARAAYGDVVDIYARSNPNDDIGEVSRDSLNQSACTIANALGWPGCDVVTAHAHGCMLRGEHWWEVKDVVPNDYGPVYTTIDASIHVDQFRSELQTAKDKGCHAIFIFADNTTTADHLALHGPALREVLA